MVGGELTFDRTASTHGRRSIELTFGRTASTHGRRLDHRDEQFYPLNARRDYNHLLFVLLTDQITATGKENVA